MGEVSIIASLAMAVVLEESGLGQLVEIQEAEIDLVPDFKEVPSYPKGHRQQTHPKVWRK